MLFLLGTTITTSFLDSLNPSAIAQQMLLQTMVKIKRHIWFFILGIGLANLLLGLAVYYGLIAWISRLFSLTVQNYPLPVYGVALMAGVLCLVLGICLIRKTHRSLCSASPAGEGSSPSPQTVGFSFDFPFTPHFVGASGSPNRRYHSK